MGRRSLVRACGVVLVAAASACASELPPLGEVVLVVDTDVRVETLGMRLRVDVYDESGAWRDSRDVSRGANGDWPTSFSLFLSDERAPARTVLVRLRAYPDGQLRDYRGERYLDTPSGEPAELVVVPPGDGTPRLLDRAGRDLTPPREPEPRNTIDALVRVRVIPERRGSARVVLRAACFGTMADRAGKQSCIDTPFVRTSAPVLEAAEPSLAPGASRVSSYPSATECTATPRAGRAGLYDEERCVPGGTFVLGSPQVYTRENATGTALASRPERVVSIPPLLMDRYEVTVGRFRDALARGLEVAVPPAPNEQPLGTSSGDPNRLLTWSARPMGREDFPLVGVTWATARAFCRFEGGDLPTEAQWEYAATAASRALKTSSPWGRDEPTCDRVIVARSDTASRGATTCFGAGTFGVASVSATEPDATPGGILGLGGNVSEWALDSARPFDSVCWATAGHFDPRCFDDLPTGHMYRGAAWNDPLTTGTPVLRAFVRVTAGSGAAVYTVGFRCVRPGLAP